MPGNAARRWISVNPVLTHGRRKNSDRVARGCVVAKHARGFQQVLMTQESQDTVNLLILASEAEKLNSYCGDMSQMFSVQIE